MSTKNDLQSQLEENDIPQSKSLGKIGSKEELKYQRSSRLAKRGMVKPISVQKSKIINGNDLDETESELDSLDGVKVDPAKNVKIDEKRNITMEVSPSKNVKVNAGKSRSRSSS